MVSLQLTEDQVEALQSFLEDHDDDKIKKIIPLHDVLLKLRRRDFTTTLVGFLSVEGLTEEKVQEFRREWLRYIKKSNVGAIRYK